jgi:glycosyltransferase involved in cell wall biosynthesis
MSDKTLSVIIPARNELFLYKTIEDLLKNIRGEGTEIIAVLDGEWPYIGIEDNPKLTLIHHNQSIGQRAATNEAARLSRAKYLIKLDAHCSVDEGFDIKMMEVMQDNWTMVPVMRNLHAFDWVCKKCGHRRYQGPTPKSCPKCDNTVEFAMDMVWIAKTNPQSTSYCFDSEPHFQYFREFKERPEAKGDLTETMSLQGSCFMVTRDKFFELDLCDESWGSWGSQGIEVSCKTHTSGGKVIVNHKTWYAHMFRTQGGDFGFPYKLSGKQVSHAKKYAKDLFFNNKWDKQIYPLSYVLDKFWPVPGWSDEEREKITNAGKEFYAKRTQPKSIKKGLVYYTDNRLDPTIMKAVQDNLVKCCPDYEIISVSLEPIDFGKNIVLNEKRGYLTMFKQILAGLEASSADIVFLVEHDVLYSKEHFDFIPPKDDVF